MAGQRSINTLPLNINSVEMLARSAAAAVAVLLRVAEITIHSLYPKMPPTCTCCRCRSFVICLVGTRRLHSLWFSFLDPLTAHHEYFSYYDYLSTCPLANETGMEIVSPTGSELNSISLDVEQANDDTSIVDADASPKAKAKTMKASRNVYLLLRLQL